MRFSLALLVASAAAAVALPSSKREEIQTVDMTFHGGPAEYSMSFLADGEWHNTNNNIAVSIIDTPNYYAYGFCQFSTDSDITLVTNIAPDGTQQLLVGPPQPIHAVRCQGFCVPTWSECYVNNTPRGPCCAGFCAAGRCRPWVNPTA